MLPVFWSATINKAIDINEIITPKQKFRACSLIFVFELPPIEIKLRALSEIIGKTQGIRFKISPPMNAKTIAFQVEIECFLETEEIIELFLIIKDSSLITKTPSIEFGAESISGTVNTQLLSSRCKS